MSGLAACSVMGIALMLLVQAPGNERKEMLQDSTELQQFTKQSTLPDRRRAVERANLQSASKRDTTAPPPGVSLADTDNLGDYSELAAAYEFSAPSSDSAAIVELEQHLVVEEVAGMHLSTSRDSTLNALAAPTPRYKQATGPPAAAQAELDFEQIFKDLQDLIDADKSEQAEQDYANLLQRCKDCGLPASMEQALKNWLELYPQ
jgi:hypothetical protein